MLPLTILNLYIWQNKYFWDAIRVVPRYPLDATHVKKGFFGHSHGTAMILSVTISI